MLKVPIPEGGPRPLFKAVFGKLAIEQDFRNTKTGDIETFLLFDYKQGTPASIIFPLTPKQEVVAIRQFRYGVNECVYELPGGIPELGDSPEDVVKRELKEETGFVPDMIRVLAPRPVWFEPANLTWGYWPCLGINCKEVGPTEHEQTEHTAVELFSVRDWLGMIRDGLVCDSKSIATTFLALAYI